MQRQARPGVLGGRRDTVKDSNFLVCMEEISSAKSEANVCPLVGFEDLLQAVLEHNRIRTHAGRQVSLMPVQPHLGDVPSFL